MGAENSVQDGMSPVHADDSLPDELAVEIKPLPGADQRAVEIGERYWALHGIDSSVDPPRPRWRTRSRELSVDVGVGHGRVHLIAANGVRAVVAALNCPKCDRPLSLRSRQHLQNLLAGKGLEHCVDCDALLLQSAAQEADPAVVERRRAQHVKAGSRRQQTGTRNAWEAAQAASLLERCAVRLDPDPDWSRLAAAVRTEVAALAAIRYAPTVTPTPPMETWPVPLTPTPALTAALMSDCCRAGLMAIHPDSPVSAFVWTSTFDEAAAAAGGDPSRLPTPEWDRFYPARVSWYAPTGPTLGSAAERLDEHLQRRLYPATLGRRRHVEFLDLVVELIAEETLRYFRFQLERHNLPEVPANHVARLAEAARRLAAERSLAETYNTAWTTVRTAAATAQAKPSAPKANMTTHAVNLFEAKAQEQTADRGLHVKPFHEDSEVPLSAMTRTVFLTLLDADMLHTTRADAEAILAAQAAGAEILDEPDVDFNEMMRAVLGTATEGDPHAVYAVLGRESANDDPVIAAAATKLIDVVEDLRLAARSLPIALAGAVTACRLLTVHVLVPDLWWGGRGHVEQPVGVYLAELMRQEAERDPQ